MSKIREYFSRNERNRRTLQRGKAPRRDRVAAEVKSRTPVYRDRVNPATGRPHTDDRMMHRVRDEGLGKMKRSNDRAAAAGKFAREEGQAYRERQARDRAPAAAASRWNDPLPGERRERRPAPARKHPGRTPPPPLNSGAESRAAQAGRDMYDPPARKPQGRTGR